MKQSIYLIGSLRNEIVPKLGVKLRLAGHELARRRPRS
jgi:hypothetical protein